MIRVVAYGSTFLGVVLSVLWLAAVGFQTAQERQVYYRYLSEALSSTPQRSGRVTWLPAPAALDRDFTPADGELVGRALDEAWRLHAVAQETGNTALLSDRFSGVALERAIISASDAQAHGGRMVVLMQTARPKFYHKDGSLIQTHVEMTVGRYLAGTNDLKYFELTRETGIATLMNESNGWRLFSYERETSESLQVAPAQWSGSLRGVNYYPSETPWRTFWSEFNADIIEADFVRVRELGGNSVRVFVTRDDFLAEDPAVPLKKLEELLELADAQSLSVVPTLFDLKQDFGLATWADDALYLQRVLPVLARSPAVEMVDLKNEPDLDFSNHGRAKILAWLQTMRGIIGQENTQLPLTIGWSNAEAAVNLIDAVDVISYHEYGSIDQTADNLANLRAAAGSKSVLVSEIGASAFQLAFSIPGSDAKQADALATRMDALEGADGIMIWTLHDFSKVDGSVVGASPWVGAMQKKFGLFRVDGTEKPATDVVRSRWLGADTYPDG